MASKIQEEWVSKVLGVAVGAPAAGGANSALDLVAARRTLGTAQEALTGALTKADLQIRKLQGVLMVHPDTTLQEIAGSPDFGLNALTGGFRVRVMAALRDLDAGAPDKMPAMLKRARDLVSGFDAHVRSSPQLAACDENPIGVEVSVRPLLGDALAKLNNSLDHFAA